MNPNSFPRLDERGRGWLRFIWDKATTPDDWSSNGEPHPWWDRYSTAPMCSLARFDLHETGYVLPVMCDITPAWRETYTRIADELVGRYTTFWSAIDWLTMIGHDPNQDRYPPEWLAYLPEHLRGRYDAPGWTANGVKPWGLQPDPVGSDGNHFFRGFFNLLLCFYRYVSGDDKWEHPFKVTGYQNRMFDWDHHRIVSFMHDQWAERPQGPHCENTKIWPFCVSGAGLGLQLYDGLFGKRTSWLMERWVAYARKHYMGMDRKGNLDWFAFYYDPLEKSLYSFRDDIAAYGALCITQYVYPQDKAFGTQLYEMAMRKLGWNDPKKPLLQLHPDPRWATLGLLMAREVGDSVTEDRLRKLAEETFEPKFFGAENDRFAWWFKLGGEWPRGQLSSLMMLNELGDRGAWSKVFNKPNLDKFSAPTVSGVDYPTLGLSQCWNDPDAGALWVETYAATPSRRGAATTWKVSGLPDPASVRVSLDDSEFSAWSVSGADSIEIRSDVNTHRFCITTGYRGEPMRISASIATGQSTRLNLATSAAPTVLASASRHLASGGGNCCCPT
ncbi:MAG: linalool dehydratase/isomerase domain-containing protein [Panacagrimonas sp.]